MLSAISIFNFILRLIFNLFKSSEVNRLILDKFIYTEVISAVTNFALFIYITSLSYEDFLDKEFKDHVDFLVGFAMILVYIKFFTLFLIIPSISKML